MKIKNNFIDGAIKVISVHKEPNFQADILATKIEAFLFLSNIIVFILVPIDIAFLAGFFELPGDYLFIANLVGVAITLMAFRVKKGIRMGKEAKSRESEVGAEPSV